MSIMSFRDEKTVLGSKRALSIYAYINVLFSKIELFFYSCEIDFLPVRYCEIEYLLKFVKSEGKQGFEILDVG
jgi:hypothetical protein